MLQRIVVIILFLLTAAVTMEPWPLHLFCSFDVFTMHLRPYMQWMHTLMLIIIIHKSLRKTQYGNSPATPTLARVSLDAKNLLHNRKKVRNAMSQLSLQADLVCWLFYTERHGRIGLDLLHAVAHDIIPFLCSTQMNYRHLFQIERFMNTQTYKKWDVSDVFLVNQCTIKMTSTEILLEVLKSVIGAQCKYRSIDDAEYLQLILSDTIAALLWLINRFRYALNTSSSRKNYENVIVFDSIFISLRLLTSIIILIQIFQYPN